MQATNNNEFVLMYPGMRMTVLNRDGQLYEVRKASETLDQIVVKFRGGGPEHEVVLPDLPQHRLRRGVNGLVQEDPPGQRHDHRVEHDLRII